jgi:uncharacterized protein (TIGR02646 family)
MRKIDKGKEPEEWIEYRKTADAKYQATTELRDSLLKEQGYICAYCMRRIPVKDHNSNEPSRIEHILSRTKHPDLELSYKNMVICCPGAIDSENKLISDNSKKEKYHNSHCDKSKGENDISFSPFDSSFISTLGYKSKDGTIESSNDKYNEEINNLLNLNNALLKANRVQTLKGLLVCLNQKEWKASEIKKLLKSWDEKDNEGMYKPYCGVVVWYLEKKLRQLR